MLWTKGNALNRQIYEGRKIYDFLGSGHGDCGNSKMYIFLSGCDENFPKL